MMYALPFCTYDLWRHWVYPEQHRALWVGVARGLGYLLTFFHIGLKCSFPQSMFEILLCLWGMHKGNIVLVMNIQICNIFLKKKMEKRTLQYSCLENPMDRRPWRAAVPGVAKNRTRLKRLNIHKCTCTSCVSKRMLSYLSCICENILSNTWNIFLLLFSYLSVAL